MTSEKPAAQPPLVTGFGAIVLSVFGGIWCFVGLHGSRRLPQIWPYLVAAVVVTAVMVVLAWRDMARRPPLSAADQRLNRRWILSATVGEVVLIVIAANVLANTDNEDLFIPALAMIVGLHFIPLGAGLRWPAYYLSGGALMVLGMGGVTVEPPKLRQLVVSAAAAVILWVSSAWVLARPVVVPPASPDAPPP